ncbi:MAG: tetratricopeptide repeat protein [Bacteroidota bacterium]
MQAQPSSPQYDSLKIALQSAEGDSVRFQILTQLANLSRNHPNYSADWIEEAMKVAQKTQNPLQLGQAHAVRGTLYYERGSFTEALSDFQRSYSIADSLGIKSGQVNLLGSIGKIHEMQGDLDKAEERYRKALDLMQGEDSSPAARAFALSNMANLFMYREQSDSSLLYHKEALALREQTGDTLNTAFSHNDIAVIYIQQGELDKAQQSYAEALRIFEKFNFKKYVSAILMNIAQLYVETEQPQQAISYYEESFRVGKEIKDNFQLASTTLQLSQLYDSLGQTNESLKYLKLFVGYQDSVLNAEKVKELTKLQNNFDFQEAQKDKALAEAREAQGAAKLARQQTQLWIAGAAAILLAVVAVALLWMRAQQRKTNALLQEKNDEIGKQNKDIRASIQYAQRIQAAVLPTQATLEKVLGTHFIFFRPRDVVSGDFYFVAEQDGKMIFAAVDCTGHGVPGAFMSLIGYNILDEIVKNQGITSPSEILEKLDSGVRESLHQQQGQVNDGMDISVCTYDRTHKTLTFAGAKNPMIYIRDGGWYLTRGSRRAIGGKRSPKHGQFEEHQVQITEPTWVYLFSDGFPDQFGGTRGKKYMRRQLGNTLLEGSTLSAEEQSNHLAKKLDDWIHTGNEKQIDDVLVLGVQLD